MFFYQLSLKPHIIQHCQTIQNTSEKLASSSFTMDKEHTALPFEGTLPSEKTTLYIYSSQKKLWKNEYY